MVVPLRRPSWPVIPIPIPQKPADGSQKPPMHQNQRFANKFARLQMKTLSSNVLYGHNTTGLRWPKFVVTWSKSETKMCVRLGLSPERCGSCAQAYALACSNFIANCS